jgi:hypothetical protein
MTYAYVLMTMMMMMMFFCQVESDARRPWLGSLMFGT